MGDCLIMKTVMKYMCVTLEHTTGTYKYICTKLFWLLTCTNNDTPTIMDCI